MIRLAKPVRRLAVSVPLYSTDPTPLKRAGLQTAPHVHRPACEREGGGGGGGEKRDGEREGRKIMILSRPLCYETVIRLHDIV